MEIIHSIYDNGGETMDRYSVFLETINKNGLHDCIGLSDNPSHPQGFSQYCMGEPGPHNGREIGFFDLPVNVQQHILSRLQGGA